MRLGIAVAVVCVLGAALAVAGYALTHGEARHPILVLPSEIVGPDPLSFDPGRTSAYERAASFGLSHVLFAKSPGGVVAAARRCQSNWSLDSGSPAIARRGVGGEAPYDPA